eukprot:CAMPEP_0169285802 /NCGR_PEP_ID=MMETSP1016-20121227/58916_1 /TAXON_ID=342587 /ORGANISM="Karlodinium micrum, Strain CCMP2283" /LENGTH=213 /DNA_ID=CAMNT_0009375381 /DNA_START=703 /DNA_END=1345 /DNA_ORIENTATION=+
MIRCNSWAPLKLSPSNRCKSVLPERTPPKPAKHCSPEPPTSRHSVPLRASMSELERLLCRDPSLRRMSLVGCQSLFPIQPQALAQVLWMRLSATTFPRLYNRHCRCSARAAIRHGLQAFVFVLCDVEPSHPSLTLGDFFWAGLENLGARLAVAPLDDRTFRRPWAIAIRNNPRQLIIPEFCNAATDAAARTADAASIAAIPAEKFAAAVFSFS